MADEQTIQIPKLDPDGKLAVEYLPDEVENVANALADARTIDDALMAENVGTGGAFDSALSAAIGTEVAAQAPGIMASDPTIADAAVVAVDAVAPGVVNSALSVIRPSYLECATYGDSIVQAGGWQQYLKARLNLDAIYNRGRAGAPMADGTVNGIGTVTTILRSEDHDRFGIVTISSGTNDFRLDVPLGTIGDWATSPLDRNTFFGAYRTALDHIITDGPTARVVLCTPLKRDNSGYDDETTNAAGHKLRDYVEAIKALGAMYGLPVCDAYADSGFNKLTLATFTNDGLHPNAAGNQRLGRFMGDYIASILGVPEGEPFTGILDTFTATDGTPLAGHITDQGAETWELLSGTTNAEITNGEVRTAAGGTGFGRYGFSPGTSFGKIEATMGGTVGPFNGNNQIIFRYVDSGNYWALRKRDLNSQGWYTLMAYVAGAPATATALATARTPTNGDIIELDFPDDTVTLTVNGVNLGTKAMGYHTGATRVGIAFHDTDTTSGFDSFKFTPAP